MQAPILFFLRTPVGDVLNSFAKDQDTLDETLPDTIHMSTIYLMILLTSLAIVTVSIYYYAALTAALLASFLMMQFFYLPAATVLKRWAGETASQVRYSCGRLHGVSSSSIAACRMPGSSGNACRVLIRGVLDRVVAVVFVDIEIVNTSGYK